MERKRKRVQENMGAKEKQRVGYKENQTLSMREQMEQGIIMIKQKTMRGPRRKTMRKIEG